MVGRISYVGDEPGVPITAVVHRASNPDVARYVTADGSWYSTVSWPALLSATVGLKQRSNFTSDAIVINSGTTYNWQNVQPGKAGELIASSEGRNNAIYLSTDGGKTFTAKTGVTGAQARTAMGWGSGPFGEPGSSSVIWDPVSAVYVMAITMNLAAGAESGHFITQLWSSPDLNTWTYKGTLEDNGSGATTSAISNGRSIFLRNAAGDAILCTGIKAYRMAAGSAVNTITGWTNTLPTPPNGRMATFYRNGTFIACQGTNVFYTSTDAITWTTRTWAGGQNVERVECYNPTVGYVFSSAIWNSWSETQGPIFYKTTNFVSGTQMTFTGLTGPTANYLCGIGSAEDGSTPLCLAYAGYDGTNFVPKFATSPDGATWTDIAPRASINGTLNGDTGGSHFEWISGVFFRWGNSPIRRVVPALITEVQSVTASPYVNQSSVTLNPFMRAA